MGTRITVYNFLSERIETAIFIVENGKTTGRELFQMVSCHFHLSSDKLYTLSPRCLVSEKTNSKNIAYSSELLIDPSPEFSLFEYAHQPTNLRKTTFHHKLTFSEGLELELDILITFSEVRSRIFNFAKDKRPRIHSITFGMTQPETGLFFSAFGECSNDLQKREFNVYFNEKQSKEKRVSSSFANVLKTLKEKDQVIAELVAQQELQREAYEQEYIEFTEMEANLKKAQQDSRQLSKIVLTLTKKNLKLKKQIKKYQTQFEKKL